MPALSPKLTGSAAIWRILLQVSAVLSAFFLIVLPLIISAEGSHPSPVATQSKVAFPLGLLLATLLIFLLQSQT
jgi:hypothetical protein